MIFDENWLTFGGMVALVIAGVEFVKRVFPGLPERFYPLIALVGGVAKATAFASRIAPDPAEVALFGIAVAFAASGVYSQTKTLAGR